MMFGSDKRRRKKLEAYKQIEIYKAQLVDIEEWMKTTEFERDITHEGEFVVVNTVAHYKEMLHILEYMVLK